ncbi:SET and MYND domain containing 3, putative [Acanthamoeba castellanii str. Neff]|uniref:SET and MYND domain containing 3, putative n=1 Tax=Acanthamoeba castellanii (strain ATCC 30010 / Neff) TaxID=1257118 RepID=L8HIS3_ACACF|nr:SET and MYND domain containing 3, putative [Acanthamoeba castellanii str. Neff]ELR25095.1 SET and MYND domain containing 3, putative [Acanthamoeba castellanii str. Neff]
MLRYCNTECQRKDWAAVHKEECGMIQSVAPHKPTSSMLLMWRVLIRRIKEEQEGKSLPNFDLIRYLTTHIDAFPSEKKEHFGVMAALIKKSLPATLPTDITPQEIMHLFCLFACNNFTVSDGELKPLGLGIYPPAALINHSCDPNCVIIFEGRQCTVRSLRDITKDEEITFNYVEVGDPTETRRSLPEVTPAPKGVNEQNELRRAAKYDREGAEAKKTGDLVLARKKYKRAFKIRRSLLLAHDPLLGFNLNELMNLCISLAPNVGEAAWREALLYCSASLAVFERIYPPRWPLVGLQYLIHGKLSFYLKYTEAALESMQRALPILTITHSSGHPLVRTLHTMLAEATAEWNYEKDHNPRLHRLSP